MKIKWSKKGQESTKKSELHQKSDRKRLSLHTKEIKWPFLSQRCEISLKISATYAALEQRLRIAHASNSLEGHALPAK